MSSRNIAIRKDVYETLRRERRPGESFTKVVLRLVSQKGPLVELEGAWPRRYAESSKRAWRRLRGLRSEGGSRR